MILQKDLLQGFNYFFSKKYSQIQSNTDLSIKIGDKFLLLVDKKWKLPTIGYNWLFSYLTFQFEYWEGCDIQSYNKKINFSFIFGEKAFQRYLDRDQEFDYQFEIDNDLLNKYNIRLKEFLSFFQSQEQLNFYQNPHRLIGLNSLQGFNNCIQFTTLYDPLDSSCIKCNSKHECKLLLQKNFPEIYKSRINGKTSNK